MARALRTQFEGAEYHLIQCKPRLLRRVQSRWGFQRGEAAALPFGRTRGFKPSVRYNLIVRGNNRQPLFRDSKNRKHYLELLKRYRELFGYRLYAYNLLTNHLQLLLETPKGNVSKIMQCLGTNYAAYFNRKYKRRLAPVPVEAHAL